MGSKATSDDWQRTIWKLLQFFPLVRGNSNALSCWDEQVGKWMADGVTPDLVDLVRLFSDAKHETKRT